MSNIGTIAKAWYNVFTKQTTQEHKRRAEICNKCELAIYKPYTDFIKDELVEVRGFVCGGCGCPLISKIRSTDGCPQNKW